MGCLERASGVLFLTPGHVDHFEVDRRVFSFKLQSLVLLMLSRDRSPKILRSGLWSTAMVRLVQPNTKCLALSKASATASASPSSWSVS